MCIHRMPAPLQDFFHPQDQDPNMHTAVVFSVSNQVRYSHVRYHNKPSPWIGIHIGSIYPPSHFAIVTNRMTLHGSRTKPVFASGTPAWGGRPQSISRVVRFFSRQALTPRSLKKQLCGPKASETAGGHFLESRRHCGLPMAPWFYSG